MVEWYILAARSFKRKTRDPPLARQARRGVPRLLTDARASPREVSALDVRVGHFRSPAPLNALDAQVRCKVRVEDAQLRCLADSECREGVLSYYWKASQLLNRSQGPPSLTRGQAHEVTVSTQRAGLRNRHSNENGGHLGHVARAYTRHTRAVLVSHLSR